MSGIYLGKGRVWLTDDPSRSSLAVKVDLEEGEGVHVASLINQVQDLVVSSRTFAAVVSVYVTVVIQILLLYWLEVPARSAVLVLVLTALANLAVKHVSLVSVRSKLTDTVRRLSDPT